uniref:Uncharacterized protein n=1 Tax=Romanomermis culicivorax TaxID=13658 RepID=A0A915HS83_ROMCU
MVMMQNARAQAAKYTLKYGGTEDIKKMKLCASPATTILAIRRLPPRSLSFSCPSAWELIILYFSPVIILY